MPRIRKIEEEIKQFIASGDIDQAARKADEIPEALRSQELCDLIKESQDQPSRNNGTEQGCSSTEGWIAYG